ncbi:MAG: restriction endonuclease, partial [Gammaproteobacteria bacterium]
MNYEKFCQILNFYLFGNEKRELLKKIALHPERFIGLFRPSKAGAKILQNILQSREIKFGDALEKIFEEIVVDLGYKTLDKTIVKENGERLELDLFFTDGNKFFFVEMKVRDDHDSSKKRGQITNFEAKLEELFKIYDNKLIAIMYFVDPYFVKNQNFYLKELSKLEMYYGVSTYLFYG